MRILLLAPHPFFQHRGTPISEKALLEVLSGRGDQVDLLTYHEGEDLEIPNCTISRIAAPPGIHNIRPGFSFKKLVCDVYLFFKVWRFLRRQRYDLIHAVEESSFIALALGRPFKVPYVYDMDSSLAQQMEEKYPGLGAARWFLESCERTVVRQSLAVVAVCKALSDRAETLAPGKSIALIEDFSLLTAPDADQDPQLEEIVRLGPIVMYVGNLERYQGIDLLLEAFPHVAREVPEAQLVVIGGTPEDLRAYRGAAEALGLGRNAHFLGPRSLSRLSWYLERAEILVSPRIKGQNTPMKVYSYLDSGKALLATRLATHTQVLDDDIAVLVEPEAKAMAEGLVKLLKDQTLRSSLAQRAKERVRREYSHDAYRRKFARFYDEVERALPGGRGRTLIQGKAAG